MNFFIYGSRRSGKTTKAIEIAKLINKPIVFNGKYVKHRWIARDFDIQVYSSQQGLNEPVVINDDIDSIEPVNFHLGMFHNIVTATPDNTKDNPSTFAYEIYQMALNNKWAIINLNADPTLIEHKASLPDNMHLGQIYGKWYDPEQDKNYMLMMEEYLKSKGL